MSKKDKLTVDALVQEAKRFTKQVNSQPIKELFGVTDGKAVGTMVEHMFFDFIKEKYDFERGSSAKGIDFPELEIDVKVTSSKQPQSSCPFKEARQKIYGLGYGLIVFVYNKEDDLTKLVSNFTVTHAVYISKELTSDYQTTRGIIELIERDANQDDIFGFLEDRKIPVDEIGLSKLAVEILRSPPKLGYLTISNALQWRLQYGRVLEFAEKKRIKGIVNIIKG